MVFCDFSVNFFKQQSFCDFLPDFPTIDFCVFFIHVFSVFSFSSVCFFCQCVFLPMYFFPIMCFFRQCIFQLCFSVCFSARFPNYRSLCIFRAFFPCITKGLCYNVCFHFVSRPVSVMSLRFQNPTSFVVSGPSGVGKSYWVLRQSKATLPSQVVYHYEVWQAMFDRYTDKINFKQGMPSLEDLKESRDAFLVLDDFMFANSEFLSKIYSVYSHHFHFNVLMTVQNLW